MTTKRINRIRRQERIRAKLPGTAARPRISVFKSNKHIFIQAIDDANRKTLASANDAKLKKSPADAPKELGSKEKHAFSASRALASELQKLGVNEAIFDKGGYKYHGRIKAVAEGLRQGGIKV